MKIAIVFIAALLTAAAAGAEVCGPETRCTATGAANYTVSGAVPEGYETGSQGQNMLFTFAAEPGLYQVDLHFLEHELKKTGARQMRVWVNDSLVLENFDAYARGGHRLPVVRGFMVPVIDSTLRIQIQAQQSARKAIISRIGLSRMSRVFWLSGARMDE